VQWLENRGNLEFKAYRIAEYAGASSPQPADVDGDGDLDVVVTSAYNLWEDQDAQSMIWLENDGSMQFARRNLTSSPTHLITLSVGDFNSDGKADLVTGGMYVYPPYDRRSRVTLWTNHWPGGRSAASPGPAEAQPEVTSE
jgi:hypothetical protein